MAFLNQQIVYKQLYTIHLSLHILHINSYIITEITCLYSKIIVLDWTLGVYVCFIATSLNLNFRWFDLNDLIYNAVCISLQNIMNGNAKFIIGVLNTCIEISSETKVWCVVMWCGVVWCIIVLQPDLPTSNMLITLPTTSKLIFSILIEY